MVATVYKWDEREDRRAAVTVLSRLRGRGRSQQEQPLSAPPVKTEFDLVLVVGVCGHYRSS
jgi:hypothetical protein